MVRAAMIATETVEVVNETIFADLSFVGGDEKVK
jgi:hypothetical protein